MNTQTIVTWPTGNSYEGERWRVRKVLPRDIVIENNEGYRATVSPLSVIVLNEVN